jgi:hypothetical protein
MLAVSSVRLFFSPQVLGRWNRAEFCFVHIAWDIRVRMYVICVFQNCNGFWQLLRLCCFILLWLLYLFFQHYCSLKWKVGITLGVILCFFFLPKELELKTTIEEFCLHLLFIIVAACMCIWVRNHFFLSETMTSL